MNYRQLIKDHGITNEIDEHGEPLFKVKFTDDNLRQILSELEKFSSHEVREVCRLLQQLIFNKNSPHYQEPAAWRLRVQRPKAICVEARTICLTQLGLKLFKEVRRLQEDSGDPFSTPHSPELEHPKLQQALSELRAALVDYFHGQAGAAIGEAEEPSPSDPLEDFIFP